jgi:hypothetical protein
MFFEPCSCSICRKTRQVKYLFYDIQLLLMKDWRTLIQIAKLMGIEVIIRRNRYRGVPRRHLRNLPRRQSYYRINYNSW